MEAIVSYVLCYSSAFLFGFIVGVAFIMAIDYVRQNN
jgi:hypothetical protein